VSAPVAPAGAAAAAGTSTPSSRTLRLAAWTLVAVAVAVSLAGATPATLWARLFFGVVLLAGAVALAGLAGAGPQVFTAAALLILVVVQRGVQRPVAEPPSPQWTRSLQGPEQAVEQSIALPLGTPGWERVWQRAAGAFVYVCARSPLDTADGLELTANGVSLGTITEAQAIGPRPGPTFVGFYRVPIARDLLERRSPARFDLKRLPGASSRAIPICGTFSYRPSAGPEASRYFDGTSWWLPGPAQGGRFTVEVRVEDATGRPIWVTY
jgi:hypothetical protein